MLILRQRLRAVMQPDKNAVDGKYLIRSLYFDMLRYFVVHNYVVNGDSYTGNMIHNYYLYEEDGRMSMIPWDYNLAFGTFQGGSASSSVNEDIDDVLSDRPMQAWIFSDETYSQQYYALYAELLEQVDVQAKTSEDEALLIYKKLRDRMYARLLRWQDAALSERSNLIPMDYEQYDQWSENARLAREEYVQRKLTAEEFLRKIDTTHELPSYEAGKIDLPDGPSMWQRLVEKDFRFDPERYFPKKMARLNLSDPDPQWQILTAYDLRREAQKGHQSL